MQPHNIPGIHELENACNIENTSCTFPEIKILYTEAVIKMTINLNQ